MVNISLEGFPEPLGNSLSQKDLPVFQQALKNNVDIIAVIGDAMSQNGYLKLTLINRQKYASVGVVDCSESKYTPSVYNINSA